MGKRSLARVKRSGNLRSCFRELEAVCRDASDMLSKVDQLYPWTDADVTYEVVVQACRRCDTEQALTQDAGMCFFCLLKYPADHRFSGLLDPELGSTSRYTCALDLVFDQQDEDELG